MKAADVVGRGEGPHEDHVLSRRRSSLRFLGAEHDPALGRAGRGRHAAGQLFGAVCRIERGVHERSERSRVDLAKRLHSVHESLGDGVDGKPDRGEGVPLGASRLEDEQAPLLHGVLDILDVAVMPLKPAQAVEELSVDLGHPPRQAIEVLGVANPRHHVLSLGVDEEVAVRSRAAIASGPG